jgi:hypothetical protein
MPKKIKIEQDPVTRKPKAVLTEAQKEERRKMAQETRLANQGLFVRHDEKGNAFRAVRNTLLRNTDVQKWESGKFIVFFTFLDRFYSTHEGREGKLNVTLEKIELAEKEYEENPDIDFGEFLWRIDRWCEPYDASLTAKFNVRLMTMSRVVVTYCKRHPVVITDEIREICKGKKQYEWMFTNFRVVTTKIGAQVVEPNTLEFQGNIPVQGSMPNAEVALMESIKKVASVYDMIAGSITKKDIEKLNVKDKISALQKLSFIHSATKGFKPNNNTFKQINIYKAGKDELEASLLDFAKEE